VREEDEHPGGPCYHCKKQVGRDNYCYGCKEYICDDCNLPWSVADAYGKGHHPEDHIVDPESAEGNDTLGGF